MSSAFVWQPSSEEFPPAAAAAAWAAANAAGVKLSICICWAVALASDSTSLWCSNMCGGKGFAVRPSCGLNLRRAFGMCSFGFGLELWRLRDRRELKTMLQPCTVHLCISRKCTAEKWIFSAPLSQNVFRQTLHFTRFLPVVGFVVNWLRIFVLSLNVDDILLLNCVRLINCFEIWSNCACVCVCV